MSSSFHPLRHLDQLALEAVVVIVPALWAAEFLPTCRWGKRALTVFVFTVA